MQRPITPPYRSRLVRVVRACVMLAVACLAVGCSARGGTGGGRNMNVITAAEMEEQRQAGVADLYELINRARPRWLQIRNERSLQLETVILVYHRDVRLGGTEVLRGYPLTSVTSIRYLDAAQAMLLPGAGSAHVQGAIVITTSGG